MSLRRHDAVGRRIPATPVAFRPMPEDVQNPLFARFFHRFCGRDRGYGERELRRELLAGVAGRVVEVGAGNGINFEHYPPSVTELIAVEPEPYLRRQAE